MHFLKDAAEEQDYAPNILPPTADDAKDAETVVPLYRAPEADDMGFLFNCWLRTLRVPNKHVPADKYFPPLKSIIARIAQQAHVLVACDQADPEYILAYAVADPVEPPAEEIRVHFAYTKRSFRRMGLQKELMKRLGYAPGMQISASFWTYYLAEICREQRQPIALNPYFWVNWLK